MSWVIPVGNGSVTYMDVTYSFFAGLYESSQSDCTGSAEGEVGCHKGHLGDRFDI